MCKGKLLAHINPWHIVDFLSEVFLVFWKICDIWHVVISTILILLIGYSVLKFHGKTSSWTISAVHVHVHVHAHK